MKEEKLMRALGGISEYFIEEAAPKHKTKNIVKWSALAASLILVLCLAFHIAMLKDIDLFLSVKELTNPNEYHTYTAPHAYYPIESLPKYMFGMLPVNGGYAHYPQKMIPYAAEKKLDRYIDTLFCLDLLGNEWYTVKGKGEHEMLICRDRLNGEYTLHVLGRYFTQSEWDKMGEPIVETTTDETSSLNTRKEPS